jgi:hypothetical protein
VDLRLTNKEYGMRNVLALISVAILSACADDRNHSAAEIVLPTIAETSDIRPDGGEPGVTPFIYKARLVGVRIPAVTTVSYTIEPKHGAVSRPVHVTYSRDALRARGNFETNQLLVLPIFGLYAGYSNSVSISLGFADGSSQSLAVTVDTASYVDPNDAYDSPTRLQTRSPGSLLGFDFFAIKSGRGPPVIIDTDGDIRWTGEGDLAGSTSAFTNNAFVIGDPRGPVIHVLELDGSLTTVPLNAPHYLSFHHNIDPGKFGLLGEVDTTTGVESVITEFHQTGALIKEWDFAQILSNYMTSQGDDPAGFVRPGVDWFHSNAATYDPRDDSLLVSSRENFVIKVDYETGEIRWVFGDPGKYWWTFPSLRAKALTLSGDGLYPIGQHALSLTSDGLLMLFNNGYRSLNQPVGVPTGESRSFSTVSAYQIDDESLTATEVWRFDYNESIYSAICSSAYEAGDGSLLLNYSWIGAGANARVVGLNPQHEVVFDFQYPAYGSCQISWNAVPIPFENFEYE